MGRCSLVHMVITLWVHHNHSNSRWMSKLKIQLWLSSQTCQCSLIGRLLNQWRVVVNTCQHLTHMVMAVLISRTIIHKDHLTSMNSCRELTQGNLKSQSSSKLHCSWVTQVHQLSNLSIKRSFRSHWVPSRPLHRSNNCNKGRLRR